MTKGLSVYDSVCNEAFCRHILTSGACCDGFHQAHLALAGHFPE